MHARFNLALSILIVLFTASAAMSADTYGAGVSLKESTPIAQLLERPAGFEGKTVRIEGVIRAVCTHMGCWMAIAANDKPNGATLLLKVDDGVIVFPVSARGKQVTAQGVIERIGANDPEGHEAAEAHAREGQTAPAAPAQWRLKATGAIIQ
jgi:hypothetical protein